MDNSGKQKIFLGIIFLAILALLLSLSGNIPKAFAQTTNQTNVSVEVAATAQITVWPTNMTWWNVYPGTVGGLKYLTIKNTGSTNISTIYGYADTLTSE